MQTIEKKKVNKFKKEGKIIMILEYKEIKEAAHDSYKSLHDKFHYTPQYTLYTIIGEYDFDEEFSKSLFSISVKVDE